MTHLPDSFTASTDNARRLTVLFADAEEGWQNQVGRLLEPQGVQAVTVRTGREALSRVESGEVHVAVLDQHLPQLSGLQVVKLMRDKPASPPTILLARDMTKHVLSEALGMKVFSVLSKPVDLNLMLETLARVIKRKYADKWPG
jgi:CheY-like chemotaxis protein